MTNGTRTLTRREPTSAVHPFDRLFQGLIRDPFFSGGMSIANPTFSQAFEEGTLEIDLSETEADLVVRASVPGFKREDITVDIHDGVLTIGATMNEETEEQSGEGRERYYRRERRTGSVSRRIALPVAVKEEAAKATLNDGVLELRLPKDGSTGPRRIAIS